MQKPTRNLKGAKATWPAEEPPVEPTDRPKGITILRPADRAGTPFRKDDGPVFFSGNPRRILG